MPPPEVRTMIVSESGLWRVRFDSVPSRPAAAKILREALEISPKESLALVSPGNPAIWKGTKVEVEWLLGRLGDAGVLGSAVIENPSTTNGQ